MSNKERFLKRKRIVKITWTIVSLLFFVITVLLIILDLKNEDWMLTPIIFSFVSFADIFCLTFLFCSLLGVKFHTYKHNEHEISLYLGWSCGYLLLDDEIVDKHTGSWWGASPMECDLDGEKVFLKVGAFTLNNYTLCVGNKVLH